MIYSSREDAIVDNYFTRINEMSFSTINGNFNARPPQPITWFFLGLTTLIVLKEGKEHKKISAM